MSLVITDPDSGISTRFVACDDCEGVGHFEIELDWDIVIDTCKKCNGTGLEEIAF